MLINSVLSRHPKDLAALFCVLAFLQPVTPVTSRMKEHYHENTRMCTRAPCHEVTMAASVRRRGLEELKKTTSCAAKWSQYSCGATHIVRRYTKITFSQMKSEQTTIESSTHLQNCLCRPLVEQVVTLAWNYWCNLSQAELVEVSVSPLCSHLNGCSFPPHS